MDSDKKRFLSLTLICCRPNVLPATYILRYEVFTTLLVSTFYPTHSSLITFEKNLEDYHLIFFYYRQYKGNVYFEDFSQIKVLKFLG